MLVSYQLPRGCPRGIDICLSSVHTTWAYDQIILIDVVAEGPVNNRGTIACQVELTTIRDHGYKSHYTDLNYELCNDCYAFVITPVIAEEADIAELLAS